MERSTSPYNYRKEHFPRPKLVPSAHSGPAALASSSTSTRWAPVNFGDNLGTSHSAVVAGDFDDDSCPTARPVLSSKFSSDNLSSSKRMLNTKAWLRDLTNSNRSSASSSISQGVVSSPSRAAKEKGKEKRKEKVQEAEMVISLPQLVYGDSKVSNLRLGLGAHRVDKPIDAFSTFSSSRDILTPPPRSSEDSVRSYVSATSTTSSFGSPIHKSQNRALPLLPLRVDSLPDHRLYVHSRTTSANNDAIEHLASVSSGPSHTENSASRHRTHSNRTEDSIPFGHSAISRPSSPVKRSSEGKSSCPAVPPNALSMPSFPAPKEEVAKPVPPFQAMLARRPPSFPAYLNNEDKLVSLQVSGKTLLISLASLLSQPSHLADYVRQVVLDVEMPSMQGQKSFSPIFRSTVAPETISPHRPQLVTSLSEPVQATLQFPPSPISGIRSARASIFEDVPHDECEQDYLENEADWAKSVTYLRPPSPELGRRNSSNSSSSSSRSKYSTNFLDTTPDAEAQDPFHFQHFPASSQPPSLSSSPSSSAFDAAYLDSQHPFDSFASHDTAAARSIDILLDRPSEAYETVLHYLREKDLPRKLKYSTSAAFLNTSHPSSAASACSSNASTALEDIVKTLPVSLRPSLLPLLLHPTFTALEDVMEEAAYLGMTGLYDLCKAELSILKSLLTLSGPANLSEQRSKSKKRSDSPSNSPTKTRVAQIGQGVIRPKLYEHRQFHSEADVPRDVGLGKEDSSWI